MNVHEEIIYCPRCGAVMKLNIGKGVYECEYCGVTIPIKESDK